MPGEYGSSGYDTAYADPSPGEYIPRFSRDKLDPVGQKLYDQLKDQRDRIEKAQGADKARQLYSDLPGRPDETLALMAEELRSTGMTDIYKIKQDTQRIPIQAQSWSGEGAEGGYESGTNYFMPDGSPVPSNLRVQQDPRGNYYAEKTSYINTETGQPLATNADRTPFSGRQDILSDYSVRRRRDVGTGVQFTPEGIPIYFAEGAATPSSWKSFTNQLREAAASPVGKIAMAALLGPYGAGLSTTTAAALAGGISGLSAEGDIGDALKGAALGYAGSELFGALTGNPALDAGMGTYDVSGFSPPTGLDAGMDVYDVSSFTPYAPGEAGIQQILQGAGINIGPELPPIEVTPLSGEVLTDLSTDELLETALSGEVAAPTEPFDITDVVPAESVPEWDTGYPTAPEVPQGSLAAEVGPPEPLMGPPEPLMGPPEPLTGPPEPSTGERAFADIKAFAATPLGKLALSLGGSALVNKLFEEQKSGSAGTGPQGWSGTIPKYEAVRERVPFTDTLRRPGEYGRRYFSDTAYVPMQAGEGSVESNVANIAAAKELARQQASGLASIPTRPVVEPPVLKYMSTAPSLPPRAAPAVGLPSLPTYENEPRLKFADGGIAQGRYLNGATDGMEDKVPAHIDGKQPARLSHGEFVIPADVVSHLGNGNSQAGAKRLYDMMDRIRQARTGTTKQGKQIQPDKYLPR